MAPQVPDDAGGLRDAVHNSDIFASGDDGEHLSPVGHLGGHPYGGRHRGGLHQIPVDGGDGVDASGVGTGTGHRTSPAQLGWQLVGVCRALVSACNGSAGGGLGAFVDRHRRLVDAINQLALLVIAVVRLQLRAAAMACRLLDAVLWLGQLPLRIVAPATGGRGGSGVSSTFSVSKLLDRWRIRLPESPLGSVA